MYDPKLVQPMRDELTKIGCQELRSPEEVDKVLGGTTDTCLVVVNSVCGCAAGGARPAVGMAIKHPKRPKVLATVFAGQDREATERARSYFVGFPPSSPSFALLKGGKIVHLVPRQEIEGRTAEQIAATLTAVFEKHC